MGQCLAQPGGRARDQPGPFSSTEGHVILARAAKKTLASAILSALATVGVLG
jgi:hypothetical protein